MATFQIWQSNNGQYYFSLKADNGKRILVSEGYTSRTGCMHGIETVKKNAQKDESFVRMQQKSGNYSFFLRAINGQIIAISETYLNLSDMEEGIEYVKRLAPAADISKVTVDF